MKITEVEALNYYDGIIEFLGMIEVEETWEGEVHTVRRFVYGVISPESSATSDAPRVYDCWTLPPRADDAGMTTTGFTRPDFQVSEHDVAQADEACVVDVGPDTRHEPVGCPAVMYHGPGHQSRTVCERTGPHSLDDEHYARNPMEPGFEWTGREGYS